MGVDIKSEKNLGLIGSILGIVSGFVGVVPYVGAFGGSISLVAFILVLVALHGIGNKLGDDRPFRYYLYSVIVAVAGIIIAVILVVLGILTILPAGNFDHGFPAVGVGIILMAFLGLIVILIVSTYFAKQAWEAMYEITGVKEFHETAKWLWWGALTAIILVGFILLLVAAIFQIIAFANLPEEIEERPTPEPAL